jgi:hypothetical protein
MGSGKPMSIAALSTMMHEHIAEDKAVVAEKKFNEMEQRLLATIKKLKDAIESGSPCSICQTDDSMPSNYDHCARCDRHQGWVYFAMKED